MRLTEHGRKIRDVRTTMNGHIKNGLELTTSSSGRGFRDRSLFHVKR